MTAVAPIPTPLPPTNHGREPSRGNEGVISPSLFPLCDPHLDTPRLDSGAGRGPPAFFMTSERTQEVEAPSRGTEWG